MKNFLKVLVLIAVFGLALACKEKAADEPKLIAPPEKNTVVYVVRHAEKASNNATDPDLSASGQLRAEALKDSLKHLPFAAIYTTIYKRTRQTVAPLAAAKNLTPIDYDALDVTGLAAKIRKDNLNETVIVVGHSNTVLEIIEALGAKRPIPQLSDSDYNYLFKVTLKKGKTPEATVSRYGL